MCFLVSLKSQIFNQNLYKIPKVNFVFSNTNLRIVQCASLVFLNLSLLKLAEPKVLFSLTPLAASALASIAALILLGTHFLAQKLNDNEACVVKNNLTMSDYPVTPRQNESREHLDLLDELCDCRHKAPCSYERVKDIVDILRKANKLSLLNAPLLYQYHSIPFSWRGRIDFTPLHYWSDVGDLRMVKLLIENGAKDHFFYDGGNEIRSSLYWAAENGHVEVAEYLLKNGSPVDIAFNANHVLRCFVPTLVFNWSISGIRINEKKLECLELILSHLKKNNPDNLKFQMRIPFYGDRSILSWIKNKKLKSSQSQPEHIEKLIQTLKFYGACEKNVFSRKELDSLPLGRILGFKSTEK